MSHDAHFTHAHMVRFDRPLPAVPEAVWAVLTDVARLPGWYGKGSLESRVGGTVRLMGDHIRGTVTQWQPPRRLAYSWNVFGASDEASPYPESYLTLELAPQDRGTLLSLTHLPVLEPFVKVNAMGWHTYLDMVDAAVRGLPVEPREAYMKRNAERYGVDLRNLPR
ncbi:SRPBCC domain-containing protein [Reyranella sp.]|uniref:SRPBCC domain-containing protein n=1 Tax=Reyranella sp. TaxID=1929291 RepID=UPI003BACDD6B